MFFLWSNKPITPTIDLHLLKIEKSYSKLSSLQYNHKCSNPVHWESRSEPFVFHVFMIEYSIAPITNKMRYGVYTTH